jgi:hypothetical protein
VHAGGFMTQFRDETNGCGAWRGVDMDGFRDQGQTIRCSNLNSSDVIDSRPDYQVDLR